MNKQTERAVCSKCGWTPEKYIYWKDDIGVEVCPNCGADPIVVFKSDWFFELNSTWQYGL